MDGEGSRSGSRDESLHTDDAEDEYLIDLEFYYGENIERPAKLSEAQSVAWSITRKAIRRIIEIKRDRIQRLKIEAEECKLEGEIVGKKLQEACEYRAQLEVQLEHYEAMKGQAEFVGKPFDMADPYDELVNYSVEHLVDRSRDGEDRLKYIHKEIKSMEAELESYHDTNRLIFTHYQSQLLKLGLMLNELRRRHHFDIWKAHERTETEPSIIGPGHPLYVKPDYPYKTHWSRHKYNYTYDILSKHDNFSSELGSRITEITSGKAFIDSDRINDILSGKAFETESISKQKKQPKEAGGNEQGIRNKLNPAQVRDDERTTMLSISSISKLKQQLKRKNEPVARKVTFGEDKLPVRETMRGGIVFLHDHLY